MMHQPITSTLNARMETIHTLLKDKNILIIEDDKTTVYLIKQILRQSGANIITRSSDIEVKSMIKSRNDIHLVIMDILLEDGMHGVELVKMLKTSCPLTPVIVQTAITSNETKQKCLESGCDGFLLKPWSCDELLNSINETMCFP